MRDPPANLPERVMRSHDPYGQNKAARYHAAASQLSRFGNSAGKHGGTMELEWNSWSRLSELRDEAIHSFFTLRDERLRLRSQ
jgi:hypothetical protein